MKLQNEALKNATLSLRFTRDAHGRPVQVVGDGEGVFDLKNVKSADVSLLRDSPGWHLPKRKTNGKANGTTKRKRRASAAPRAVPGPSPAVEPKLAPDLEPVAPPEPPPVPVETPDDPPPESEPEEAPEAPADAAAEEEPEEGPDIAALRTKAAAVKLAAEWRAKGYEIPELDPDTQKLSEMRAVLTAALYEE